MTANGFLNDDFLLGTDVARRLFHDGASRQPIIDVHRFQIDELHAHRTRNALQEHPARFEVQLLGERFQFAARFQGLGEPL